MQNEYLELTSFLSKNVFNEISIDKRHTQFSSTSNIMMHQLLNNLSYADRTFNINNITTEHLDLKLGNLPKGADYKYCPQPIRNEIESMSKVGARYTFRINSRTFSVVLICSDKLDNIRRFMNQSMKQIYMWLYTASQYASTKCSEQMNIYLYLTALPKMLPIKGKTISQVNANTAFTTSCKPNTEINLFRHEEWFKTLIHETFHNMGLDFSAYNNNAIDKEIFTMFPVNVDVRLYETYCETWAELLAVTFNVYRSMRRNTSIEDINIKIPKMVETVEKLLIIEVKHSLFQVAKILSHYDTNYEELVQHKNSSQISTQCNYKEDTPVLSYYIIRSILLFNIDRFVLWCSKNNNMSINFTQISARSNINDKMIKYCNLIREQYMNPDYIYQVNSIQNAIKKIKTIPKNKYILENLRMTITEY
jgi:hypothetical protein